MGTPTAALTPFEVTVVADAQRLPGFRRSLFIARHIEQPGKRHSKPASIKILSNPSASAWAFHRAGARHHDGLHAVGDLAPSAIAAAARRSSMRELRRNR